MSDWKTVSLGDAVTQMKTGSTPSTTHPEYFGGDVPWFTPGDIGSSMKLVTSMRTITQDAVSFGKAKLFEKSMLLVTCIGDIGRVGVLQQVSSSNQQITALRFNDEIDSDFAYYWFISNKQKLVKLANQAIVPILNNDRLSEIEFSYPPLTEQKRIASLMARADRLRQLQETAHDLSDSVLQSVFLEMFGDPKANPMGWEKARLGDVITSVQDGPHVSPEYTESGVPFLSTRNIRPGELIWDDVKYISEEDAQKFWRRSGSKPAKGDILYTKGGTTGYAKVIDFDQQAAVWVHIAVLKLRQNLVNPFWLENMLNSEYCYKQSQELTFGIVNHDFGIQRMPKVEIYLPLLSLQEEFAGVVQRVESLRGRIAEAERQVEGLFESLLEEAFSN